MYLLCIISNNDDVCIVKKGTCLRCLEKKKFFEIYGTIELGKEQLKEWKKLSIKGYNVNCECKKSKY